MYPCTVCDTPSPKAHHHPEGDLYRCKQCDHCFSEPVSEPSESYSPDYYQVVHKNWFRSSHATTLAMFNRLIRHHVPSAQSILDVGCGKGNFLRFLRNTGAYQRLVGVDLSPLAAEPGLEFIRADFCNLDWPEQFDVVTSMAVIEHIPDVQKFAECLQRACKPGGLILVMTIDDRGLLYTLARLLHGWGVYHGAFERLYSAHHLNHFNTRSLQRLFQRPGLSKVCVEKHNADLNAIDIPGSSMLVRAVCRLGVWCIFLLGRWTGRTYLQTLVLRKELA